MEFYNQRRKQLKEAKRNKAHKIIAKFESSYEVTVISQYIDNLLELAGSTNVVHLHGELLKAGSSIKLRLVYDLKEMGIGVGYTRKLGSQLRPHLVLFGKALDGPSNSNCSKS